MDNQNSPLTYWTMLFVDEYKSFEETLIYDRNHYSNSKALLILIGVKNF